MNMNINIQNLKDLLPEEFKEAEITIRDVVKYGEAYKGLEIRLPGDPVGALIKIDTEELSEIAESIKENYFSLDRNEVKILTAGNYEMIRGMLTVRLIASDLQYLKGKTWRSFLDLALQPFIMLNAAIPGGQGIVAVTPQLIEQWGITEDAVFEDAIASLLEYTPPTIRTMKEVMISMGAPKQILEMTAELPLVVSNGPQFYGATSIMYPQVLAECHERCGGDFWILPSSVHECLCTPTNELELWEAREMVHNINRQDVAPNDFLSDTIYWSDGKEVRMAD